MNQSFSGTPPFLHRSIFDGLVKSRHSRSHGNNRIWGFQAFYELIIFDPLYRSDVLCAFSIVRLHEWLTSRGLLIFDYILSDAKGLDTLQGLNQRCDVLAFIGEHFGVLEVEGVLDPESSMGITVARKRIL